MNPCNADSATATRYSTAKWLKSATAIACAIGALLAWGQSSPATPSAPGSTEAPPIPAVPSPLASTGQGDARLVSQARPLDGATSLIARLRPKRFLQHTGHFDSQGRTILDPDPSIAVGLLAQESIQIVPEAVYRPVDDSKEFWLLDHERLVPVLVRAIQEQNSEIHAQASRIQSLESQVGSLAEDLRKLKELTLMIDDAARRAFGDVRTKLSDLESKVSSAAGKAECTCTK